MSKHQSGCAALSAWDIPGACDCYLSAFTPDALRVFVESFPPMLTKIELHPNDLRRLVAISARASVGPSAFGGCTLVEDASLAEGAGRQTFSDGSTREFSVSEFAA